jgi:predicted AlkP superfamily pyrophosphatase or phosphodiesterase
LNNGNKLLVVQAAALSHEVARGLNLDGIRFQPAQAVFPAVTCTAQASFRTGSLPSAHGMIANGLFHRSLRKVMFWEQSSALVTGPRIWEDFRRAGRKVAMLFWQQSMGEDADILLTPAPIHKHHGGLMQDCYGKPDGLYEDLCRRLGGTFKLHQYWGPAASAKAGDWIAAATAEIMADPALSPGLCLTYLPTLDYDFQRFGPSHAKSLPAIKKLRQQLVTLLAAAKRNAYEVVIFGDYAVTECPGGAAFLNRALADAGLLKSRAVRGRLYADLHASRAFAMVDHEVAHIYVADPADIPAVRQLVAGAAGVAEVLDAEAQSRAGLRHASSGELVAVAREGCWFAYPWWQNSAQAPDYASHIDIHNKPGFDPCELFLSLFPPGVSQDTGRIGGTHGRIGAGRETALASTVDLRTQPVDTVSLGLCVKEWLGTS